MIPALTGRWIHSLGVALPAASAALQFYQRFEHDQPNDWWQRDCKGHLPSSSGGRCHPLTVLEDHARCSPGVRTCCDERSQTVRNHRTAIFRHYGLPPALLVDNGPPWGHDRAHPFNPLTVWLLHSGIRVLHSQPYPPQTLGKRERFYRSLKAGSPCVPPPLTGPGAAASLSNRSPPST